MKSVKNETLSQIQNELLRRDADALVMHPDTWKGLVVMASSPYWSMFSESPDRERLHGYPVLRSREIDVGTVRYVQFVDKPTEDDD